MAWWPRASSASARSSAGGTRSSSSRAASATANGSSAKSASAAPRHRPGPRPAGRRALGPGPGGGPPALVDQRLEPGGVEVVAADVEHVARLAALEHGLAPSEPHAGQDLAQPGHLDLEGGRRGRSARSPGHRSSTIRSVGDQVVGVDQQERQQGPLLGPPEVDGAPLVLHLERSEHPELHRPESTAEPTKGAGKSAAGDRKPRRRIVVLVPDCQRKDR